jgi:hypothetical protein
MDRNWRVRMQTGLLMVQSNRQASASHGALLADAGWHPQAIHW